MEITTNRTDGLTSIHPCYRIDDSYVLTSNPSAICALFHIFLGSLSIITLCGNFFVIISIIYFKQLHTPTNYLVLSLAVADLLYGALFFPLIMQFSITACIYYKNIFCKIRNFLDVSLCISSILNLCCISIDRYYAVCEPLTYRTKINDYVVLIMIFLSWGISVLIGISFMVLGIRQAKCAAKCLNDTIMANIFGPIFAFFFPAIVMLCIYFKIFLVAQKQARSIHNTTCQSKKSGAAVSKTERKATKTLAIVMGIFLICWLPFFLHNTVLPFSHVYVHLPVIELLNWLTLLNSMLNPFIYAFFYSWFRSAFRMIISGKIFRGDLSNTKLL